jgi:hypothetical protein
MPDTPIRWQRAGPAATSRYHGRRIHAPRSGKIACGISVVKPPGGRRPPHRSRCPVVAEVRTTNSWARLRGAALATARQTSVGLFTVDDGRTLKGEQHEDVDEPEHDDYRSGEPPARRAASRPRRPPAKSTGGSLQRGAASAQRTHGPGCAVRRLRLRVITSSMAIIKRSSHKGRAKRCVGRARFGHGTVTSYGFALRNTRGSLVRANRVVLSVGGDPPSGHGGEITRRTSRGV